MDDFKKTLQDATRETFEREMRIRRTPVSSEEMEKRIEQRGKPAVKFHLQPDGSTRQEVDTSVEAENERRIGFIRERLDRVNNKSKRDFHRSR